MVPRLKDLTMTTRKQYAEIIILSMTKLRKPPYERHAGDDPRRGGADKIT